MLNRRKRLALGEVVLNSLADHMKNNSKTLKTPLKPNRIIYTKLH